ncbi:iron complex transport system substrate-binding protein [Variovorax sp. NFACC28]|nr:iron complex transport system substrate-binding protein [Variovorax paradoxus]SEF31839.1 iron complex transport system substrate-binding protein [Variovorax sp. NFACC28]SEG82285.1 iron complex transport system substrate-binding protein [Variovorax sp. NFACC29]SFD07920.1 iron complex transport system substrate-binding protein [Variovorax sp. NFACC26]SFG19590.1 iron complex transport system substrate-binding protein [Variovorax sp. NFACC27]
MNMNMGKIRAALAALGLALFALAAHALDVVDERGVSVELPQPPQRIVTLLPSLTESVCALGACDRLVGVDRYSNSPAQVKVLPQLGGGIDPNVEAIVALKPDAVLLAKSSRVTQRLEALGLKVLVLEPKSHADVRRVLDKLDQVLGTHEAPKVWRVIDASVSAAAQSVPAGAKGQRVYFEVNSAPYAAGESSFIGETLARLGMKNIVPASLGPFPKLNPEYVVRANPDLIMVSVRSAQGLEQRPGWGGIRAVREGRICRFSEEQSDVLVRPGPRMDEAARLMARCLADKFGEKFGDKGGGR